MSAGSYWTDTAHLELEEIYKTPFFEAHLNLVSQEYCSAEESMLKILLQYVSNFRTRYVHDSRS